VLIRMHIVANLWSW